jgi:pyruvate formate lyase activating enzyme
MPQEVPTAPAQPPLEAKSPFELRTNLALGVPESTVKQALDSGDMGFLHSYTTGSAVDGPGVRVVAWTAGCQFRCLYCHNPDTWSLTNGLPVPLDRAVEQLRKYRIGLQRMNGGLTVSGGEPLMQHRFVVRLFTAAKQMGVHTALDTNGFLGERLADADLDQVDLVLLDIKSFDPQRHRRVTGKDVAPVLEFARRLAARRQPIWLRFVLVPGLTDDADDIARVAEFAAALGNVRRVDVLPFHQMGRFKWSTLGLDYKLGNTEPPSNELVQRTIDEFTAAGLQAC